VDIAYKNLREQFLRYWWAMPTLRRTAVIVQNTKDNKQQNC